MSLTLENITFSIDGKTIVQDINLTVGEGEIVSLLGPSGCGKTTCLRIAAGLVKVQQGRVLISGNVMGSATVHVPPEKRHIGMVLQDYALFPHLSVRDNVAFGLRGMSTQEKNAIIMPLLDRIGLSKYADVYPHTLSGGQQQRIAMARALAPNPQIMLMDEPFSGLDVALRDKIREETLGILKEMGVPTLLVTHDPEEAMRLSDKIVILKEGRIVQIGSPSDIYFHPATSQVVQFFGHMNHLTGIVRNKQVDTPLGPVNTPDMFDGQQVDIFARAQAMRIYPKSQADRGVTEATILRTSIQGATTLLSLKLSGQKEHYQALYPTRDFIAEGSTVRIELEPSEVFVFAK